MFTTILTDAVLDPIKKALPMGRSVIWINITDPKTGDKHRCKIVHNKQKHSADTTYSYPK